MKIVTINANNLRAISHTLKAIGKYLIAIYKNTFPRNKYIYLIKGIYLSKTVIGT